MKLLCIFSRESIKLMNGNRGKMAAQAGHAYLHAVWNSMELNREEDSPVNTYKNSGNAKKVCLITETTQELIDLYNTYVKSQTIGTTLVRDAGLTVFKEPTITCLGIGPILDEECGDDLNSLKVFI